VLPGPLWLTAGVVASASAATWCGGLPTAAAVAGATVAVAVAAECCGRRRLGAIGAAASLGAAMVVARLALSVATGEVGAGGQPAIPTGTGPWQAAVASSREVKGDQLAVVRLSGSGLLCSARFPASPRLIAGDTVEWTGSVEPLSSGDYDLYLAAQGIEARCEGRSLALLTRDTSPLGRLEGLRQTSGDLIQRALPEPAGGLEAAILVGLRDRVDRDLAAAFTTAGVSHVVAISGWNIAIVAGTVASLLRGRTTRRGRAVVMLTAIVAYTLFAGASPSVVRAALMAAVALTAVETGRGSRAMVGLGWAATLMIVLDPATVADPGFQLSAAATAGLVLWATPLTTLLADHAARVPAPIRDSLGVSLAAQAATLPIALLDFGRLAIIAPAANLAVVPLVPPVMATGLLAFAAGLLATLGAPAWLTGPLAMPAAMLLEVMIGVVGAFAAVPGGNQTLESPANVVAAVAALALLLPMHRALERHREPAQARSQAGPRRDARKGPNLRGLLAAAVLLSAMAGSGLAARPDGTFHVIVLDVGQGDAILLEGDRGGRILVDGGPDPGRLIAGLDRYIPAWDRRLDAIVLTHPHDDHVAGLVAVVGRFRIDRAFESGRRGDSPTYLAWRDELAGRGISVQTLRTGNTVLLDDAEIRVIWPDDGMARSLAADPGASKNRQTNDSSIVLLGDFHGRRFLLTGDMEEDIDPIVSNRGLPAVDVLKVAHHGSATATSAALLARLRPAVSIISVGADNDYGHPNGGTMARLRAASGTIARTDLDGTVDVMLDGASVTVTRTGGEPAPSPRAVASARAVASLRSLLYDSFDDRPKPSRERGLANVAAATGLAPPPLARSRRSGGVACPASVRGGRGAGSTPDRVGGLAARRRQARHHQIADDRAPPCPGFGRLAGRTRSCRARTGSRGPPRVAPRLCRVVRGLVGGRYTGGAHRRLLRQAGGPTSGVDERALLVLGPSLPQRHQRRLVRRIRGRDLGEGEITGRGHLPAGWRPSR
jgi:competence protein ComEC